MDIMSIIAGYCAASIVMGCAIILYKIIDFLIGKIFGKE